MTLMTDCHDATSRMSSANIHLPGRRYLYDVSNILVFWTPPPIHILACKTISDLFRNR